MKKLICLVFLFVSFISISQNYTNDPKTISLVPTESKGKEIKVKNWLDIPEIFIIYAYQDGQHYWKQIGTVTVFAFTEGKFYVEKGFHYGYNVDGKRPIKIGSDEIKWKVKYHRGDYDDDDVLVK